MTTTNDTNVRELSPIDVEVLDRVDIGTDALNLVGELRELLGIPDCDDTSVESVRAVVRMVRERVLEIVKAKTGVK